MIAAKLMPLGHLEAQVKQELQSHMVLDFNTSSS
jgi:hypothetical protein